MIVNHVGYLSVLNQASSTAKSTNVAIKGGNHSPIEQPPKDTVKISDAARSMMVQAPKEGQLVSFTGENGPYMLGLMALGKSTVQEWSAKGLSISSESVVAAGEVFQEAFSEAFGKDGSQLAGRSTALNKHQIIINTQEVPDWFITEYENVVSSMDNKKMKSAFEAGELFVISKPSTSRAKALASFSSVANSI